MTFKNALKITAIAAVSIPFALWFWLSFIDIASIPFEPRFWRVESHSEDRLAGTEKLTGMVLVSTLTYTDTVRCTMTATISEDNGDVVMGFRYNLVMPESWPDYIYTKALIGCARFAADEVERMADTEDSEKQTGKDDGKI